MGEILAVGLAAISNAGAEDLKTLQRAILERRRELGLNEMGEGASPSQVLEGRPYGDGWLQLERRIYKRRDGGVSVRGPYWYFRFHEGGRQRKLYLGKTADPEAALAKRRGGGGGE